LSRKRFTARIAAASTVAGCTAPPATNNPPTVAPPSAQLGTVDPAYPVGTDLAPDIEVLEAISVTELSTAEPIPLDTTDPCTSVPTDVVTPAGVATTPVLSDAFGCVWQGSKLALEIGAMPNSMAKEVEQHRAMSNGGSDPLTHLAWLRIDGHYAIERILEFDKTKSCWLTLDVSSPATINAAVYRIDPATGEPAETDTHTSVNEFCPVARQVARNLLDHLDPQQPGWWETAIHSTG
jgi:Protein of unknown function (DUF3558)